MQWRRHEWGCASEIEAAERGSRSRGYAWIEMGSTANAISGTIASTCSCLELTWESMNWNEATPVGEFEPAKKAELGERKETRGELLSTSNTR